MLFDTKQFLDLRTQATLLCSGGIEPLGLGRLMRLLEDESWSLDRKLQCRVFGMATMKR